MVNCPKMLDVNRQPVLILQDQQSAGISVSSNSLTQMPQPMPDLWKLTESSFMLAILGPDPATFCGYPVSGLNPQGNISKYLRRDEKLNPDGSIPYFGTPTSLSFADDLQMGVTWLVSKKGITLSPTVHGLDLYVIGESGNVRAFVQGGIESTFENMQAIYAKYETPKPPDVIDLPSYQVSDKEAKRELSLFFDWLYLREPTQGVLLESLVDLRLSPQGILSSALANYDSFDDKIKIYPDFIESLASGQYEEARSFLVHEMVHRQNFQEGRRIPSEEITGNVLRDFLPFIQAVDHRSPIEIRGIRQAILEELLFGMPEEELIAYVVQWADQCGQPGGVSKQQSEYLLTMFRNYWGVLLSRPVLYAALSLEYTYSGLLHSEVPSEIIPLFSAAILAERNCLLDPASTDCGKSTEKMSEIFRQCSSPHSNPLQSLFP